MSEKRASEEFQKAWRTSAQGQFKRLQESLVAGKQNIKK